MKQFAIYLRVSTARQGKSGLGLDAQRGMCDEFIKAHEGERVEEFIDVESGTHRDRRGLHDALAYCKAHDCALVIAKLDRLARDVEFCFKIVNSGVELHFTDMPQMNTLLLGVFASVAQYERELTSDRTRRALAVKKAQGAKLGAASATYRANRAQLTADEREAIDRRKGTARTRRYLAGRDVQTFTRILQRVFPDACKGELIEWRWAEVNTKHDNRINVLRMMLDCQEMDASHTIFRGWDFSDLESTKLQVKLATFIKSLRIAVTRHT